MLDIDGGAKNYEKDLLALKISSRSDNFSSSASMHFPLQTISTRRT